MRFYRELAPRIGGPLAYCHLAVIDAGGWFTIVLEDLAPPPGRPDRGLRRRRRAWRCGALARLHAPVFADPQLGATPWLNQGSVLDQALLTQLLSAFFERYGARVATSTARLCRRFVASLDGWAADQRPPLGLVHGDYRLDNMLFGEDGAPRRSPSWTGRPSAGGQAIDRRLLLPRRLAARPRTAAPTSRNCCSEYHEALQEHGVRGSPGRSAGRVTAAQAFLGVLMTVAPAMLVQRTERGDEMFLVTLARYAQQVLDLDALELLPEPGSGRPPALRPDAADEGPHEPGPEELWNESWYFDAVSADGAIGVYTRLGRCTPTSASRWMTAFVCGPDRPTLALSTSPPRCPRAGSCR